MSKMSTVWKINRQKRNPLHVNKCHWKIYWSSNPHGAKSFGLDQKNTSLRYMAKRNLGIFCLLKRVDLICMSSQTMLHLY